MTDAFICDAVRTPIGRYGGALAMVRPDDMAAQVIDGLLALTPGLAVDEVVGQRQTVIKSLGAYIGNVEGISGATINGDGTMSLILDVPTLVASVRSEAA